MKRNVFCLRTLILFIAIGIGYAQGQTSPIILPDSIFSGQQGKFHVQGAVVDTTHGHVYFSFTDKLIKMDLAGKIIGSVTGFLGHLGDLDFDADEGKIYGSLEYKRDAIGAGISKGLGVDAPEEDGFYIVVFDASRIVRTDMRAEEDGLLQTIHLREPLYDFQADVKVGSAVKAHRYGCSGIDGVALAPSFGKPTERKKYLYVAYGVYGDTSRNDNDHQVILKYDISNWDRYGKNHKQGVLHKSGPAKPTAKYFVKTGNSTYGVQNLAYDAYTGNFYAAVYKGTKPQYPNYDLFVIDGHKKPKKGYITSDNKREKVELLTLAAAGEKSNDGTVRGWRFKWGATGLVPLANGLFYISHNKKTEDGQQQTTLHKYRWVGSEKDAFVLD